MKRIIILSILLFTLGLTGCIGEKRGIIINKLLTPSTIKKGLVELKNTSSKDIELSDYKLTIYKRGEEDNNQDIDLSGKLMPNETYLIAVSKDEHPDEIKNRINLEADDLKRNGHACVAITKKGKIIDLIGYMGADTDFSSFATLVRFKGKDKQRSKFKETDYCYLKKDFFETFTSNQEYDYDEVLKGPQLDKEKILSPSTENYNKFVNDIKENNNTTNLIKVSVSSYIDGDTTYFNELRATIGKNTIDYNKVRYQGMDTPESQQTQAVRYQPYGKVASAVTKYLLKNARTIYTQISGEGPTVDTFNRALLLVWTDKTLIPFALIKNGLADFRFDNIGSTKIYYNNISLYNYCLMASFYAKENKLNIHSGKNSDDTFDYTNEVYKKGVSEDTINVYKYANLKDYV